MLLLPLPPVHAAVWRATVQSVYREAGVPGAVKQLARPLQLPPRSPPLPPLPLPHQ